MYVQDPRPTAAKLLELPLILQHQARQEETVREWLQCLGEPSTSPSDPPVFMHWNSNTLLPPPTPQGAEGSKRPLSPPLSARAASLRPLQGEEAEPDLTRVPLQFLFGPNLESQGLATLEESEAISKKPKTATQSAAQEPEAD